MKSTAAAQPPSGLQKVVCGVGAKAGVAGIVFAGLAGVAGAAGAGARAGSSTPAFPGQPKETAKISFSKFTAHWSRSAAVDGWCLFMKPRRTAGMCTLRCLACFSTLSHASSLLRPWKCPDDSHDTKQANSRGTQALVRCKEPTGSPRVLDWRCIAETYLDKTISWPCRHLLWLSAPAINPAASSNFEHSYNLAYKVTSCKLVTGHERTTSSTASSFWSTL